MNKKVSNICWTQLLVPLQFLMSKICLKYIPFYIHSFEHTSVIMNTKVSRHGFLFHWNINRPNSLNRPITMRKTKEYISDLQQKIIELHKLGSGLKKIARAVKIPISTIRAMRGHMMRFPVLLSLWSVTSCSCKNEIPKVAKTKVSNPRDILFIS